MVSLYISVLCFKISSRMLRNEDSKCSTVLSQEFKISPLLAIIFEHFASHSMSLICMRERGLRKEFKNFNQFPHQVELFLLLCCF